MKGLRIFFAMLTVLMVSTTVVSAQSQYRTAWHSADGTHGHTSWESQAAAFHGAKYGNDLEPDVHYFVEKKQKFLFVQLPSKKLSIGSKHLCTDGSEPNSSELCADGSAAVTIPVQSTSMPIRIGEKIQIVEANTNAFPTSLSHPQKDGCTLQQADTIVVEKVLDGEILVKLVHVKIDKDSRKAHFECVVGSYLFFGKEEYLFLMRPQYLALKQAEESEARW